LPPDGVHTVATPVRDHDDESLDSIKGEEFVQRLNHCSLLKKQAANVARRSDILGPKDYCTPSVPRVRNNVCTQHERRVFYRYTIS
jgi:hypothetical protein